jgi:hypothetical protein
MNAGSKTRPSSTSRAATCTTFTPVLHCFALSTTFKLSSVYNFKCCSATCRWLFILFAAVFTIIESGSQDEKSRAPSATVFFPSLPDLHEPRVAADKVYHVPSTLIYALLISTMPGNRRSVPSSQKELVCRMHRKVSDVAHLAWLTDFGESSIYKWLSAEKETGQPYNNSPSLVGAPRILRSVEVSVSMTSTSLAKIMTGA